MKYIITMLVVNHKRIRCGLQSRHLWEIPCHMVSVILHVKSLVCDTLCFQVVD
jgi:hypothetical protein